MTEKRIASKFIIETPRLLLREWTTVEKDIVALKRFLQDEEVMHTYEHAFSDKEVTNWLQWQLDSYKENEFGLWAIVLRETDEIIGECGLTNQVVNSNAYVEIGYHLVKKYWHQGYAIEAAKACKMFAFQQLKLPKVISTVRDTNIASMNVAIKNGMIVHERFVKHYRGIDMPHYLFMAKNSR